MKSERVETGKVGIIGAGQLGRMLALAGYPLGLQFAMLDPNPAACGGQVAPLTVASFDDRQALAELAQKVDLVTFEFENVPVDALEFLAGRVEVFPRPAVLETAQDRLREKECFQQLAIPTPAYRPVSAKQELQEAAAELGLPAVLKTRRLGYDGKGQVVLRQEADLAAAWDSLGGSALILESFVPFEREVSQVAVRGRDGEMVFYPLAENTHREGILHLSLARPGDPLQAQAEDYSRRIMEHFDYVGVMAFEFFQTDTGLVANEIAPRVHNSGHWTIEGTETSQFANHLRAILGWPLGSTEPVGQAAMLNFIGELPKAAELLQHPGLHLHAYGKSAAPGRKVGHATLRLPAAADLPAALRRLTDSLGSN
ncbi:5-(carboxyamino)imidazole ribonucleotide synthase [Desulfurivibrio alkaliphilus]|uniref:N5-carboxyaminoimidazole ribonucleotide synthase n=1 Tax=Desulfurivibrio alkaliphilus (strain DSM 19089 / UNIQEM U267 / AHT2) TaxID=589865 RepID=D6Z3S9_DESAT|nr:5-(carboxyamino)imidazole ribonucleotide synthase [Desulfurivibrio alkaliphilus]ADH86204.1 phosphoribosylaminoimidazole carboxylase, ATPase subunit [Desulfurivibrio alkaliphilus AHT 2]